MLYEVITVGGHPWRLTAAVEAEHPGWVCLYRQLYLIPLDSNAFGGVHRRASSAIAGAMEAGATSDYYCTETRNNFV